MAKQTSKTFPRVMPLLVGMTAGMIAIFVIEVALGHIDMHVETAWSQLTSGAQLHFASATVYWAIAGAAFVVGAISAALLVRFPPPWHNFRTLRWIIGAAIVFGLALVADEVGPPHDTGPGAAVAANFAAIVIGAVMGLVGASFARTR